MRASGEMADAGDFNNMSTWGEISRRMESKSAKPYVATPSEAALIEKQNV